jgi:hypothetical protein
MQKPTIRYVVAAVLIAAAALGGVFVFDTQRRAANIAPTARQVGDRIEQLITAANDVAAAQQAYVSPGQPQQPWFERSATALQQFGQQLSALRGVLTAPDALASLNDVNERFKAIVVIDGRTRVYLGEGENLLAADLIFSEGRDSIAAVIKTLRMVDAAEQEKAAALTADLERQQWGALGAIAVIWFAGLVLLTPATRSAQVDVPPADLSLLDRTIPAVALRHQEPATAIAPATIDLDAIADICGALARTSDADSLRDTLARAAAALEARGIVVWLGAGEELFPALACGYDERLVARLGPIPRNATNATAAAWRSAQIRTVPADATSHGAIAVPLSGVNGCVGVFAAELPQGRESDGATRAAVSVIAAQLAAIVPAWPAPSASQPIAASGG